MPEFPTLDVHKLDQQHLRAAVAIFNDMRATELLPVHEIAHDKTRHELDRRVVLEVPTGHSYTIYPRVVPGLDTPRPPRGRGVSRRVCAIRARARVRARVFDRNGLPTSFAPRVAPGVPMGADVGITAYEHPAPGDPPSQMTYPPCR